MPDSTLKDLQIAVGKRVRLLREAKGWKQQALATMIGEESHSTISDIENGKRMPKSAKLRALARAFDVTVAYLLGETQPDDLPNPEILALKASLRSELERIRSCNEDIADVLKQATQLLDTCP